VQDDFDACQRMVKAAFTDTALSSARRLCSANSINIGRLLPQMVYYAAASLALWRETGERPGMIVPTGNLGNALACLLAREVGLPIGPILLATNANRTIPEFLQTDDWRPRPSIATLASAMDVGNPSNMERVRALFGASAGRVSEQVRAWAVDDADIEREIVRADEAWGEVLCPHTATASHVYRTHLSAAERGAPWVIVATAHPAKFETVVEPLIGRTVPVPDALRRLMDLPSHSVPIPADVTALRHALD
jgi:threonine synthase